MDIQKRLRVSLTANRLCELMFAPLENSNQLWMKASEILPNAFDNPEDIGVGIHFRGTPFGEPLPPSNENLIATPILIDDEEVGKIVAFYKKQMPERDIGPFTIDEYTFLREAGVRMSLIASQKLIDLQKKEENERVAEELREEKLNGMILEKVTKPGISMEEILKSVTDIVSLNFGKIVKTYIEIEGLRAGEPPEKSVTQMVEGAITDGEMTLGRIIIYFREDFPQMGATLFTKRDKLLVNRIANILRRSYLFRIENEDKRQTIDAYEYLLKRSKVPVFIWDSFGEMLIPESTDLSIGPDTPEGTEVEGGRIRIRKTNLGTIAVLERGDPEQLETAATWVDSLTLLFEELAVPMAIYDSESRIVMQSRALGEILGYLDSGAEKRLFGTENNPSKTVAHLVNFQKDEISRDLRIRGQSTLFRIDVKRVDTPVGTLYPVLFQNIEKENPRSREWEEGIMERAKKDAEERIKKQSKQIERYVKNVVVPLLQRLSEGVTDEKKYVIRSMRKALKDLPMADNSIVSAMEKLTPREVEITNLIREGRSSQEISERLDISVKTVQKHRNIIRNKLNIINRGINLKSYLRREI